MPPPYCYDHPRPMVTVDLVAFTMLDDALCVLLIRRKHDPFAGKWAIPGGYLELEEPVQDAARRELREETGMEIPGEIEPIGFFGAPGRDPRGRTITLAHAGLARPHTSQVRGGDDAAEARWVRVAEAVDLAFDHAEILAAAKHWLSRGLVERALALQLLPPSFERRQVDSLFQDLALTNLDARDWLEKLVRSGALRPDDRDPDRFHPAVPAT